MNISTYTVCTYSAGGMACMRETIADLAWLISGGKKRLPRMNFHSQSLVIPPGKTSTRGVYHCINMHTWQSYSCMSLMKQVAYNFCNTYGFSMAFSREQINRFCSMLTEQKKIKIKGLFLQSQA